MMVLALVVAAREAAQTLLGRNPFQGRSAGLIAFGIGVPQIGLWEVC